VSAPYFDADGFRFRPIVDGDVARLVGWLRAPEVGAWWHGVTETYDTAFVREHMLGDEPHVVKAIVELDGLPIGFQQWYPLAAEPDMLAEYRLTAADAAFAIDQFVGESRLHGTGVGTRQVRAVSEWLVGADGPGARRVFTDPVVENARAVRCYEKAGFTRIRVLPGHEQLDGEPRDSWLMELTVRS
jgi:aminoglycoside 6'-N-acetyltransferase